MAQKQAILVVFDVGGSLAKKCIAPASGAKQEAWDAHFMALQEEPNMVAIVKHYLTFDNIELMFCTGRPKSSFRVTWQWLNKTLGLTASGKRVSLACRPDAEPLTNIPACKLSEIVQAIRRIGSRPAEVFIYDNNLSNLRLFESLRPMVANLRLFKVEGGVATAWSL